MKHFIKLLIMTVIGITNTTNANSLDAVFSHIGLESSMIIESLNTDRRYVYNKQRANERFSPASTFKILNTLISLEESAVTPSDILEWDATEYPIKAWNKNHTLRSAFKASCVWCYQKLALKVGMDAYQEYIQVTNYGDLERPAELTQFWLDGSLTISAEEQISFLKKIHQQTLPFNQTNFDLLSDMMLAELKDEYQLYARTGWTNNVDPSVGWYIGYLETNNDTWFFALNLATRSAQDLPLRKKLTMEAFQAVGILSK